MSKQQSCDRCGLTIHYWKPSRIWFCDDCEDKNQILFEGVLVSVDPSAEIKPGDAYLAKRNTGWKLLTCKENKKDSGFIVPEESKAYWYDTHECFKVVSI